MTAPDTQALAQVVKLVKGAADMAILRGGHATRSEETRAALTAAFECALGNGLIRLVPPEEFPEYVAMDPPYRLPGWSSDQSTWPAHLRDDAPRQRCTRCLRYTCATSEFGQSCSMPQPDGRLCGGRFEPVNP